MSSTVWYKNVQEEPGVLGGRCASSHEHVVVFIQPNEAEVARPYGQCREGQTLLLLDLLEGERLNR